MDVTNPYEFIGFGAMGVTKPCKFIGFGARPCERGPYLHYNSLVGSGEVDTPAPGGGSSH